MLFRYCNGSWSLVLFFREILEILDTEQLILPWDPTDLGSWHFILLSDPMDLGS